MHHCPQCGEATERLYEGYCKPCCQENQAALDLHNATYDRWRLPTTSAPPSPPGMSGCLNCLCAFATSCSWPRQAAALLAGTRRYAR